MVAIAALMVGGLEAVTVPIERRHVEKTLTDGLASGAEWIGQIASDSFASEMPDELSPEQDFSLDQLLEMTRTLDIARLQELGDQMRSEDMAYTAIVDDSGAVVLSDQIGLIGEVVEVRPETTVEDGMWRGDEVWIVSTPLRRGEGGEQIGALRMAARRRRGGDGPGQPACHRRPPRRRGRLECPV
jgi:hypothetical protein